MTVVTRFPPSPTGFMHIGNARTALYNWLFARGRGGKMLFRIEDTDRARHSEEAVLAIVNGLKWLELDWDGEIVSQFERSPRHVEVTQELLKKGHAYKCYCSPQELEEMREKAKAEGRPTFYDRRWRDSAAAPPAGVNPVIRIKAPLSGETIVKDHVQGEVKVANEQLDDFILLRSDGTPTYLLAVVVDDHDMGVNYVIRGDDHLNNTFRQNIIYDAMGWAKPEYAHLPLILGPDGAKMSKRHGAATVEEYREMGYLPEAMRNYLLRLGWSHGDDEMISTEQAIKWFGLDHVHRSPARFDFAKLESVNAHYIQQAGNARLLELITPFLLKRHHLDITDDPLAQKRLMAGMDELKKRAKTLLQITDEGAFFAKKLPFEYDAKARETLTPDAKKVLAAILTRLEEIPLPEGRGKRSEATQGEGSEALFTFSAMEQIAKQISQELTGGKLGAVAMPLRAALTGTTISPSIFHAAEILGRDETLARIKAALS